MWALQLILFGFAAVVFYAISTTCSQSKKPWLGLTFALLGLASVSVSASAWAWALKVSGKADWYLLGLCRYTLAALVFLAMFALGLLCVAACIRRLAKSRCAQSHTD